MNTPRMSKYVVAVMDGAEIVSIFPTSVQHRQAVPAGATPVSAGFLLDYGDGIIIPEIPSETLGLGPRPEDKDLIASYLSD